MSKVVKTIDTGSAPYTMYINGDKLVMPANTKIQMMQDEFGNTSVREIDIFNNTPEGYCMHHEYMCEPWPCGQCEVEAE